MLDQVEQRIARGLEHNLDLLNPERCDIRHRAQVKNEAVDAITNAGFEQVLTVSICSSPGENFSVLPYNHRNALVRPPRVPSPTPYRRPGNEIHRAFETGGPIQARQHNIGPDDSHRHLLEIKRRS